MLEGNNSAISTTQKQELFNIPQHVLFQIIFGTFVYITCLQMQLGGNLVSVS